MSNFDVEVTEIEFDWPWVYLGTACGDIFRVLAREFLLPLGRLRCRPERPLRRPDTSEHCSVEDDAWTTTEE
jgi:hypothetical protein